MTTTQEIIVRPARHFDRRQISSLVNYGTYVHRHLDWRSPVDWIGYHSFWVVERNAHLIATLACPPDPNAVAWIRLFALNSGISIQEAWSLLWAAIQDDFSPLRMEIAAIPVQRWFQELLQGNQFAHTTDVVMLSWEPQMNSRSLPPSNFTIRKMEHDDLAIVQQLDSNAFSRLWQISFDLLETAWSIAAIATVAEDDMGILGYQISTANSSGGHLARLAVRPKFQGRGIGRALLMDMFVQFERWGTKQVTVNTQADNIASLALYEKVGFRRTRDIYPVYQAIPNVV